MRLTELFAISDRATRSLWSGVAESASMPRMQTLYHVTASRNVPAIQRRGLMPRLGRHSRSANERQRAIYLFPDADSAEDAVMNWDWWGEDEPLSLLRVAVDQAKLRQDPGMIVEFYVTEPIPPSDITVVTQDF